MGANFYDHFKNKDLKNIFKRLCIQNQQRKFNALWQMLDQLTAELVKEYGKIFRQRTMQSVSIWLCVLVVPFHLWELLSSSCMGA